MAGPATIGDGVVILTIRLTPNARDERLDGPQALADGRIVLAARVRAVPENGAANAALINLLAKTCDVAKSRVSLVAGNTQRLKTIRIEGDPAVILAKLSL